MGVGRRDFCLGALGSILATQALAKGKPRPNFVFILADDMGWGDPTAFNAKSGANTPNIDRLARQGMRFTDMHSSSSVCTPSRYSILTGRYCWRSRLKKGVTGGFDPSLIERGRLTVAGMLKRAGYYTAGVGKWHLGLGDTKPVDFAKPFHPAPTDHGFDYYFGIPASLDIPPYLYFENDRALAAPTARTEGKKEGGVFWRAGEMAPGFDFPAVVPTLTDKAVSVLNDRAKRPDQPFFLYFPLPSPHTPWLPTDEFKGTSQAGLYGDYVRETDAMVGRVLDALEKNGQADNTVVIFTSDNGAHWKPDDQRQFPNHHANGDWKGMKADVWEGGHRIPFVIRWPGQVAPGTTSTETASLTDFMATAAAITGTPLPTDAAEDSFDLTPALKRTNRKPIRSSIIDHSIDGMFTIREGDWKLELGLGSGGFSHPAHIDPVPGGPQGQLYNLASDPRETTNVWSEHPEIVARLTALLKAQQDAGRTRPK
ncbi:arylsulfatase [Sphingomonas sp. R-74633]|uniref:sulfatase family protein n=1 Tax=Sphingomonas sp. R-74633 TaxID=2751188 RepID=UPI0015D441DD|nr:arylsulfatase [Sphingomonas sp. R-74633]NYT41478.1 arylsulfatase [Sphingomonas sp. R-74633]